jgi:hypothetical protein
MLRRNTVTLQKSAQFLSDCRRFGQKFARLRTNLNIIGTLLRSLQQKPLLSHLHNGAGCAI